MLLSVLGPVEATCDARPLPLPGPQLRCVLGVLACDVGKPVPADRLIEALWDAAPATARTTVQVYVSRLRKALARCPHASVVTAPGGYRLDLEPDRVDVHRFRGLVATARATGDQAASRALLGDALALWRGTPLADVAGGPLRDRIVVALAEERMSALEQRVECDLTLGRHREIVGELTALVAEHHGRERLVAALMLALYRSGRRTEALRVFRDVRRVLVTEAGLEPSPALQQLHRRLLAGEGAAEGAAEVAGADAPVPRQLPPDVPGFTGRLDRLRLLDESLPDPPRAASNVAVLVGTAGVGKTALALHWAHRVADRFPDGQLYVDLLGFAESRPLPAGAALGGFLRALGVAAARIPADAAERAGLYRSLLRGRRVLIVLDNARCAEQIRPLLPGTPTCAVVVTSRDDLAGLVARDGARLVIVEPVSEAEAMDLLRTVLGAERVDADPDSCRRLVRLCAALPLALRVAAQRAVRRPGYPISTLADQLADEARRLDLLSPAGDPATAVRAVLSWSYHTLPAPAALVLRRLSVMPGADFGAPAVAAVAQVDLAEARRQLDTLTGAHIVAEAAPDRYRLHDLLRAYAAELAGSHDAADERRAAATRLVEWYLHTATEAMELTEPRAPQPARVAGSRLFADYDDAQAWLAAERGNLVAAARLAADTGRHEPAWRLPLAVWRFFMVRGYIDDWLAGGQIGLAVARRLGDAHAEAELLGSLGAAQYTIRRYDAALDHYEQALALRRALGDPAGQARMLANIAIVHYLAGRYPAALEHSRRALLLCQRLDAHFDQASAHNTAAGIHLRMGHLAQARHECQQALLLFEKIEYRFGHAVAVLNLGQVHQHAGEYESAADHCRRALDRFREIHDQTREGLALCGLGRAHAKLGRLDEALRSLHEALAIGALVDDADLRGQALYELGETLSARGDVAGALGRYEEALSLARSVTDGYQEALVHAGLARLRCAAGEHGSAGELWRRALDAFTALGVPDAHAVRGSMAACARCRRY